ncbi:MAG: hypothetical protein HZA61_12050 [Candidatus Eisenbacteria bacterium]|uniref:Uncharacterized protein n=1 Tax=Eiseniibacteriota bacterium TaxID=2212470 RepID=A0A933SDN7_UNCEI|nr:hypothetical protein [Candidatus Eisenbacteria bacterium]
MHRFHLNRLWTLLLALFLSVAGLSVLSNVARSDSGNGGWSGDDEGEIHVPDQPPPTGSGDPDSPSNGGKPTTRPSVNGGRVGVFANRGAGDASGYAASAWSIRVRLMMHALRAYYLRW